MLERREFQLLLTDLRLPGPSGLELLRLANERRPARSLYVGVWLDFTVQRVLDNRSAS
jgi:CheY-like chemotaxis protein